MERYRVSAVSYLNTKPFLFGIEQSPVKGQIELSLDYPSDGYRKVEQRKVDLALVPVASMLFVKDVSLVTNYCIASEKEVLSVCIFSQVPIESVRTLILDYQSLTSVILTKILLKHYWQLNPEIIQGSRGYERGIAGTTAGLIIGDRALELQGRFKFRYDLASHWNQFSGLPFVFAAWLATRELDPQFTRSLEDALKTGVENIPAVAETYAKRYMKINVLDYLTNNIKYQMGNKERLALQLFLKYGLSIVQKAVV